jgi:hypothetical protein
MSRKNWEKIAEKEFKSMDETEQADWAELYHLTRSR